MGMVLLAAYAILLALNIPTYHAFGRFDSYHEGESLGAAVCYLAGEKPYHDFTFFHGLIQDPLRSAWAFRLFGKGIAAERAFESLAKVLAWVALALFLGGLFRQRAHAAALVLSLFALGSVSFSFLVFGSLGLTDLSPASLVAGFQAHRGFWEMFDLLILTPRFLATFLFLFVFIRLQRALDQPEPGGRPPSAGLVFFFSFLPLAAMGYAVDCGLYLAVLYAFLFPILYFVHVRPRGWEGKWFLFSGLGAGTAFLFLEGLSGGCWMEGLKWIFLEFPAYKGLSESVPVPIHQWKFLFFFALLSALAYRLGYRALAAKFAAGEKPWSEAFLRHHLVEGALLLLAGLHFTNVLVRADEEHLIYSLAVLYILVAYLLDRWAGSAVIFSKGWARTACVGLAAGIAFFCLLRDCRVDVLKANFPLGTPDEAFIPPGDQETIRILKAVMAPSDGFFTLTSEASWYYFLDKPCPTRFPYLWTAAPLSFQQEAAWDLEEKKVKWVLFKDPDWSYQIDGISNEEKFPLLAQFIRERYRPYRTIEDNEVWVLKQGG